MRTEIKNDAYGRQWGYLLLTPAELETLKKNMTASEAEDVLRSSAWITSDPGMVPHGYEVCGRDGHVFICVEHGDEKAIALTFKRLENRLNA